jgi:hypothetical protein
VGETPARWFDELQLQLCFSERGCAIYPLHRDAVIQDELIPERMKLSSCAHVQAGAHDGSGRGVCDNPGPGRVRVQCIFARARDAAIRYSGNVHNPQLCQVPVLSLVAFGRF